MWWAINKARLADNIISRKYSCEKLKLMLSCYVKLVTVSFSSISWAPIFNPLLKPLCLCSITKFIIHFPVAHSLSALQISFQPSHKKQILYFIDSTSVFWLDSSTGTEDYRSKLSGDCFADLACPEKCRCEGTTVDCSNQKLNKIPDHIPQYTAEL